MPAEQAGPPRLPPYGLGALLGQQVALPLPDGTVVRARVIEVTRSGLVTLRVQWQPETKQESGP